MSEDSSYREIRTDISWVVSDLIFIDRSDLIDSRESRNSGTFWSEGVDCLYDSSDGCCANFWSSFVSVVCLLSVCCLSVETPLFPVEICVS